MADITKIQPMGDSTQYNLLARGLKHADQIKSSTDLDNFLESSIFKVATFDTKSEETNTTGLASNDGLLLSMGWTGTTTYGFQLIVDDAANNTTKIRAKNSTWANWSTLLHEHNYTTWTVKKDGTGATGTWGISITGNAATASKCSSANLTDIALTYNGSYSDGDWMLIHNGETGANGGQLFRAINKANTAAWVDGAHKWVRISGDTMTGSLTSQGVIYSERSGAEAQIGCKGPSGQIFLYSENGTASRGLYTVAKNGGVNRNIIVVDSNDIVKANFTGTTTIINNSQNESYDALLYVEHKSNNEWNIKVNSEGYDYGITVNTASGAAHGINANGRITGNTVYGAVWNDYAECRNIPIAQNKENEFVIKRKIQMAGTCVYEVGDGTMMPTTKRLQRGCRIISDTFGFNIGETEDAKTPVAVAGRVLANPYEDREEFKKWIGYGVCSGPNGTVSIMTEEEERQYPMSIIGIISEVPDYEIWGENDVDVNGRIWIYVK